ncbi:MAG: serine--tRNA ligase, partial [Gammaproteobacteria bacterium]
MLDLHLLRQDPGAVAAALKRRGFDFDQDAFERLEQARKGLQTETESLQAERNRRSKAIGAAKARGEDIEAERQAVADLGERLKANQAALEKALQALEDFSLEIPNLPHSDVPDGLSEADNVELRRWGQPRTFDFAPLDHVALGEQLTEVDFETAARLASARFVVLSGGIARMQRALTQFMLDTHVAEHGYREVYVPYLVNERTMRG